MSPKIYTILFFVAIAALTFFAMFFKTILIVAFAFFSILLLNIIFGIFKIPNIFYWPLASLILVWGSILVIISTYPIFSMEIFLFSISAGLIFAFLTRNDREKSFIFKENMELINSRKYNEANENLNKLLEKYPNDRLILLNKISILIFNNDYSELLSVSNKILEKHPKDSYALNAKAHALIELGKYEEADTIVNNVLEKEKNNETALANKGEILSNKGNHAEAIEYYDKALKNFPDKQKPKFLGLNLIVLVPVDQEIAKIWISKGQAHKNLSEFSEALESFNQALILDPDSSEAKKLQIELESWS